MEGSILVTHCGAGQVNRDALAALPAPTAMGPRHRPIPHAVLVDAIRGEATTRGLTITKEQYALAHDGAALFGVLDFDRRLDGEAGFSIGFRSSQDQTLALLGRAGLRVFVCDNLALSGSTFAFQRKHTSRLDLDSVVRTGFDRYEEHADTLGTQVARLRAADVTDSRAKEVIYDAVAQDVVPARLLPKIHAFYFRPTDERPDCQSRTLWGLHNAFTRAFQELKEARAWKASSDLGRLFGLVTPN